MSEKEMLVDRRKDYRNFDILFIISFVIFSVMTVLVSQQAYAHSSVNTGIIAVLFTLMTLGLLVLSIIYLFMFLAVRKVLATM